MKSVTVVVPCYNEQEVVSLTFERLKGVLEPLEGYAWRILFVDDGSTDRTLERLERIASEERRVSIISFSRNFGHEAATTAGLFHVETDFAVIIDADLQDPPELIPEMLRIREREGCNVVYGVRRTRSGDGVLKRFTAKVFYRFMQRISDDGIPLDAGNFRLVDRAVLDAFRKFGERSRFIRGLFAYLGFQQVPVFFDRQPRAAGTTKYPYSKMIQLALNAVLSHSTKPLRIATHLGWGSTVVGLGLAVYAVIGHFVSSSPGWASTIIVIVFFGGVQLLTIGILGHYLGTVLIETKARPLYIVRKRVGFPSGIEHEVSR